MPDGTLLEIGLYEPTKATERAELRTFYCVLPGGPGGCPLFQRGGCLSDSSLLGGSNCLYGRSNCSRSATKRAKAYYQFVKDAKVRIAEEKAGGIPKTRYVRRQLTRIGDYVLFPDGQVTSCEAVPFRAHRAVFFGSGSPWLKVEDFTPENLLLLFRFRPRAYDGREITSYQKEEVPKLLLQLRFRFPELFAAVMEAAPELAERVPDHTGFVGKAIHVTKFPPGPVTLRFGSKGKERMLAAQWDGERLTADLDGAARTSLMSWGETVTVTFTPGDQAECVVTEEQAAELYESGAFD